MANSSSKALGKFLPNPKLKLRAQLAEVCRYRHMSHRTEKAYWSWIRDFLRFQRGKFEVSSDHVSSGAGAAGPEAGAPGAGGKLPTSNAQLPTADAQQPSSMAGEGKATQQRPPTGGEWRHPRELGAAEVRDYLSHLAVARQVAAATQRQALNGMVFLYQEVPGLEVGRGQSSLLTHHGGGSGRDLVNHRSGFKNRSRRDNEAVVRDFMGISASSRRRLQSPGNFETTSSNFKIAVLQSGNQTNNVVFRSLVASIKP